MFSWNLITNLLSNEITWVFVAFVAMVAFGYKPVGAAVFKQLDAKINEAKTSIEGAIALKQNAVEKLEHLHEQNRRALVESEMLIRNAREEANKILRDAQEKVNILEQKTNEFIDEQNDVQIKLMLENIKRDVLLSVVTLAGSKLRPSLKKSDPSAELNRGSAVEEIQTLFKNIKRIWN